MIFHFPNKKSTIWGIYSEYFLFFGDPLSKSKDRYPKLAARDLANGARLVGIAKGAGMIEPNMATMLCFLMTDAKLSPDEMQEFLSEAVSESFNAISVDGDESTSDAW